jgi:hypothetical protein
MYQLKMDIQQAIITLSAGGWSQRRIAHELRIDRETVARYRGLARQGEPLKPAIVPTGSDSSDGSNPAIVPPGLEVPIEAELPPAEPPKPAIPPTGSRAGRVSHCEPFESFITTGLDAGLSEQRIYQDLVIEQKFVGSYDSVKRFVRQLGFLPFPLVIAQRRLLGRQTPCPIMYEYRIQPILCYYALRGILYFYDKN